MEYGYTRKDMRVKARNLVTKSRERVREILIASICAGIWDADECVEKPKYACSGFRAGKRKEKLKRMSWRQRLGV